MLFGDTDIKRAVGKFLAEDIKAGARWHRAGDGDNALVMLGFLDQRIGEYLGVGRRFAAGLRRFSAAFSASVFTTLNFGCTACSLSADSSAGA